MDAVAVDRRPPNRMHEEAETEPPRPTAEAENSDVHAATSLLSFSWSSCATVIVGLRENRNQEGTHRFYRFRNAAARSHAPFLSGAAVSIDQM